MQWFVPVCNLTQCVGSTFIAIHCCRRSMHSSLNSVSRGDHPTGPPPSIAPESRPHSDPWDDSDDGGHRTDLLSADTSLPLAVEYQPHSAARDDNNDDESCTNFLSANNSPPITEEHRDRSITAADESNSTENVFYELKQVDCLYFETPIILQDKNGPCPLIAICNVLLLRREMDLGPVGSKVRHDDLIQRLAHLILERCKNVEGKDESLRKQQMSDALDILPKLGKGLNVNFRFRKIDDFEATPECAIFDVLGIGLYHGWLVDPEHRPGEAVEISREHHAWKQPRRQWRNRISSDSLDSSSAVGVVMSSMRVWAPRMGRIGSSGEETDDRNLTQWGSDVTS